MRGLLQQRHLRVGEREMAEQRHDAPRVARFGEQRQRSRAEPCVARRHDPGERILVDQTDEIRLVAWLEDHVECAAQRSIDTDRENVRGCPSTR